VNHPLRENLEVYSDDTGTWIRCTKCLHVLCPSKEDWRKACKVSHSEPTKASPLMTDLVGQFLLEQIFCPSCGALMDTDIVEIIKGDGKGGTA